MSSFINAIVINGYIGKELTLEYLNKMLIMKGINVMYLKLNHNEEIVDILVNDRSVNCYTYKDDEIIFDEFDIVSNIYEKNNCSVLITKSSKYNSYLNIVLYIISRCNKYTLAKLRNNNFLTKQIPIITATQSKDIMTDIHNICNTLKIIAFISEHFHYSYIKYDTGINMDYSYLSFTLALNTSVIFESILKNEGKIVFNYPRVKMYGLLFYKVGLPSVPSIKIKLDTNYHMKIVEKYNVRFYCNAIKTASSASEITEWFMKQSNSKNHKICIFHTHPSLELIDIINNLCAVQYKSVYIVNYNELGSSYRNLIYANKYNVIPEFNAEWTETIYEAFANKINKNITIDNLTSIVDWIFKYSGLHDKLQFDILCAGSKKMIDDIISKIN